MDRIPGRLSKLEANEHPKGQAGLTRFLSETAENPRLPVATIENSYKYPPEPMAGWRFPDQSRRKADRCPALSSCDGCTQHDTQRQASD